MSPKLLDVNDELDHIVYQDRMEVDLNSKRLDDLGHRESVDFNKIAEIESELEKLTRNGRSNQLSKKTVPAGTVLFSV
ncbi:DUF3461 family protein [Erwinia amylovora]|uniref:DUF3461 family protein n=1 Tax=Erwinia amylovora TaxID=552 RepID=UPI003BA89C0F